MLLVRRDLEPDLFSLDIDWDGLLKELRQRGPVDS
jgi:hypothetical protein